MLIKDRYIFNNGYIFLPIDNHRMFNHLKEVVVLDGEDLTKKDSFHISLLCTKELQRIHSITESDLVNFFAAYVADLEHEDIFYSKEYRQVSHIDGRKSIVQKVSIDWIADFYRKISLFFGVDIEEYPTHVTLYTSNGSGIGIHSIYEYSQNKIIKTD